MRKGNRKGFLIHIASSKFSPLKEWLTEMMQPFRAVLDLVHGFLSFSQLLTPENCCGRIMTSLPSLSKRFPHTILTLLSSIALRPILLLRTEVRNRSERAGASKQQSKNDLAGGSWLLFLSFLLKELFFSRLHQTVVLKGANDTPPHGSQI